MNHVLAIEVDPAAHRVDKLNNDSQVSGASAVMEIQAKSDDVQPNQTALFERFHQLEAAVKTELDNFKKIVQGIEQQLDQFQKQINNPGTISHAELSQLDQIRQMIAEHDQQLKRLQAQRTSIASSSISPEKLREELVAGIRMLGERVTKAIAEMNSRLDQFTKDIQEQLSQRPSAAEKAESVVSGEPNDEFAALKESKLLDADEFEVVPREAIQRLTELFKKQSAAVKSYISKHEERIQEFEKILKVYDEENTRLLDLLNRRVRKNLMISLAMVLLVVLWLIIRGWL